MSTTAKEAYLQSFFFTVDTEIPFDTSDGVFAEVMKLPDWLLNLLGKNGLSTIVSLFIYDEPESLQEAQRVYQMFITYQAYKYLENFFKDKLQNTTLYGTQIAEIFQTKISIQSSHPTQYRLKTVKKNIQKIVDHLLTVIPDNLNASDIDLFIKYSSQFIQWIDTQLEMS